LVLKTLELGSKEAQSNLTKLMSNSELSNDNKVESVKELFTDSGAAKATQDAVKAYTNKAFKVLEGLNIPEDKKQLLRVFGEQLMTRRV